MAKSLYNLLLIYSSSVIISSCQGSSESETCATNTPWMGCQSVSRNQIPSYIQTTQGYVFANRHVENLTRRLNWVQYLPWWPFEVMTLPAAPHFMQLLQRTLGKLVSGTGHRLESKICLLTWSDLSEKDLRLLLDSQWLGKTLYIFNGSSENWYIIKCAVNRNKHFQGQH